MRHPEIPEIDFISYVMLIGDDDPGERLAARRDRAERSGRPFAVRHRATRRAWRCWRPAAWPASGSRFIASVADRQRVRRRDDRRDDVGDRPAVLPRISGRGWVVGTRTAAVDPTDPYPLGYVLSDVWDMTEQEPVSR